MRNEIKVYADVQKRMYYFDGIKNLGRTLAAEALKLLDSAKDLKEAIDRTLKNLQQNYSDAEIEENFGEDDEDWIADFTQ